MANLTFHMRDPINDHPPWDLDHVIDTSKTTQQTYEDVQDEINGHIEKADDDGYYTQELVEAVESPRKFLHDREVFLQHNPPEKPTVISVSLELSPAINSHCWRYWHLHSGYWHYHWICS